MPVTIQLRGVPDAVKRNLKAQAASKGVSLSDYVIAELTLIVQQPTLTEIKERLARFTPVRDGR